MIYLNELFEKYKEWKILRFFLENPGYAFYVNETAQKVKVSSGSVSKFLKELERDRVVKKRKIGNSLLYELNDELLIVKQLKVLVFLLKLEEFDIVKKFLKEDEGINSIVVYGSYASGENDEKSDLDLLIISNKKGKQQHIDLIHEMEEKFKKAVNLEIYDILEWKKIAEKNKEFYQSVKENHLLLYGGELI